MIKRPLLLFLLLLFLLVTVLGRWLSRSADSPPRTPVPGVSGATTDAFEAAPAAREAIGPEATRGKGQLYLRAEAGTALYADKDLAAPVLLRLEADATLAVEEKLSRWYRVRHPAVGGEGSSAWIFVASPDASRELVIRSTSGLPRQAEQPDARVIAAARRLMEGGGRESRCGPYALFSDVADQRLLAACGRLASALDATYAARYGVSPIGRPAEAILLFSRLQDFRSFVRQNTGVRTGYAAHAEGSRGYLALYSGGQSRDAVLGTLVHELTHLVNRRAVGPELPRWLSEGLADGIGDAATESGLQAIDGANGVEAEAARLLRAYADGRVGGLHRLLSLDDDGFDAEIVSFDYEQSAFVVRFLLSDPRLAPRFRAFLGSIAEGGAYSPELLRDYLGLEWLDLDRELETWLQTLGSL